MKLTSSQLPPSEKRIANRLFEKYQTMIEQGPVLIPALLLFICSFWTLIFFDDQFCVRDSANFYYPLFQQIQGEWKEGRIPLWDPYDNLGQPLAANPTSSVFYPGKLIFFLFPHHFDFAFKWYILLHYPLAFWGMYRLLRNWKISSLGAGIGALSWTFGGNLFFQYCNLIFLVGAAWFPWGIQAGLSLIQKKSIGHFIELALILALMILGGEPQTAYLTGLFLIFWALCFDPLKPKTDLHDSDPIEKIPSFFKSRIRNILLLAGSAFLAGLLAAVQLIPGNFMARQCDRFSDSAPVSLWGIPSYLMKSDRSEPPFSGILCENINEDSHSSSIYHFSFAPWRTLEFFWPNIGGDFSSGSSRWLAFLPYDDQIWNPTIYMGIIPLLLGLSALSLWRFRSIGNPIRSWISWILILSFFASWGGFGAGWICRFLSFLFGSSQDLSIQNGDPVGGVYWFLNLLLPGFSLFRYPAKMLVPAAFALSALAGFGWDLCIESRRFQKIARSFLILSLIGTIVFFLLGDFFFASWKSSFGTSYSKFDVFGARKIMIQAFFQGVEILFLLWVLFRYRDKKDLSSNKFSFWVLMIVVLDLLSANARFVYTVPRSFYHDKPLIVDEIERSNGKSILPPRVFRYVEWNPLGVIHHPKRIQEGSLWDRKTLAPKYSYPDRIGVVNAQGTMMNRDYAVYLKELKRDFIRSFDDPSVVQRFQDLDISYFILPHRDLKNREVKISNTIPMDRQMPRLYSFFDEPEGFFDNLGQIWPPNTLLWKFKESGNRIRIDRKPLDGESARLTCFEPNRLEMEISLKKAGAIILSEQYWTDWKAIAHSKADGKTFSLPIFPEKKIMRRLELPPGDFQIIMEYSPSSFYWGGIISLLALFITFFLIFLKKNFFYNGKIFLIW